MKQATKSEVEEVKELATVAPAGELATINFEEDAGVGLENVRPKDISIPFFTILQKGSPQVDELSGKAIPGAVPGMIMNTASGELYDGKEGIPAIPCGFSPELIEWKSRDSGGGFVARHTETSNIVKQSAPDERGRLITPNGNLIVDTKYHFVVHPNKDGSLEWGIVSMTSTQLKKSRQWLAAMKKMVMPSGREFPSFSHIFRLTTVGETKDKYSWYGWKIEVQEKITNPAMYNYAKSFAKAIAAGSVQASAPPSNDEPSPSATDHGAGDNEPPF